MESTEFVSDDVENAKRALWVLLLVQEGRVETERERHLVHLVEVGLQDVSVEDKEHVEDLLLLLRHRMALDRAHHLVVGLPGLLAVRLDVVLSRRVELCKVFVEQLDLRTHASVAHEPTR